MRARTSGRRSGGSVGGGCLRSGSASSRWWVACAISRTALSNASCVAADGARTPLTLRTYWSAAASTSSAVAGGWRPRRVVMLRHMRFRLRSVDDRRDGDGRLVEGAWPEGKGPPVRQGRDPSLEEADAAP